MSAASTVQPWSPYAWNARRSAWIPALPPESLPAIVRQQGKISSFMADIISNRAEKAVGVFVGDPLKFRGGEIENVSCLGKDVGN